MREVECGEGGVFEGGCGDGVRGGENDHHIKFEITTAEEVFGARCCF